jgi:hypothetical protein
MDARSWYRWGILSLVAVGLAAAPLLAVGCSSENSDAPEAGAAGPVEEETPAAPETEDAGEWLAGRWIVDFALDSVDPDASWSRQAADQPSAEWDCEVDGSEMTIDTGLHVYSGTLAVDPTDDSWHYDAMATYPDEEGVVWTSHIIVEGTRMGEDGFEAEQWGEISSDVDGVLYTATWDAIGTRVK